VAQLNSALDYGSRGYWFESSRGHQEGKTRQYVGFFYFKTIQTAGLNIDFKIKKARSRA
tara:strand:+ start:365 stop:541 length:177 start_codon:yes stop_codon:yes gene_type:complete